MTPRLGRFVGIFLVLALNAPSLHAQGPIPATIALAKLKAGNARFANDKLAIRNLDTERRKKLLTEGQKPFAVILTCSDSRVAPEYIFDQGLGEIYVLRLEGNVAGPGIIGSVEYAVQNFPTCSLVVVMGHENCGIVKAALEPARLPVEPGAPESHLSWLTKQVEPGTDLPKGAKEALAAAIKNNAIRQSQLLSEKSPVIREFVQSNRIQIVPAVYSLSAGKVDWLEAPKLTGKYSAVIRVTVPTEDTLIWLDDIKTSSRGTTRVFETPPLDVEREFTYQIKAAWNDKGFKSEDTKTVRFKGGATVTVDFGGK